MCICTHGTKETIRLVNCAGVAMATLSMRRTASKTSMIRCMCSRIVDIDHMPTMWAVADIQRGFDTLLSKREQSYDTCNRTCRFSVGKRAVATQNMADAPLHQASRIGAVVPRCTTFLVFWDFLHICERRHAHAPASHDIVAVDHHAKPQDSTLKSCLLWCKKASK